MRNKQCAVALRHVMNVISRKFNKLSQTHTSFSPQVLGKNCQQNKPHLDILTDKRFPGIPKQ
jgi:hypothetical protein